MIYFKFNFKDKRDRWLFLLVGIGTAVFLGLFAAGGVKLTTYSFFCTLCHEMNPEYQTWRVSSHSSLNCGVCHLDGTLKGLWDYEKTLAKRIEKHFKGNYLSPITIAEPIPEERCLKCHSPHRKTTPRGDIIIPHDKHKAKKIACIECHRGVAHGNIADRGLTEEAAYEAWTPAMARTEMGPRNTSLSMRECMDCHESLEVETGCEDCHGVIKKPEGHYHEKFLTTHGKEARENLKECNMCHSYSKSFISITAVDEIAQYARENNFCTECHLKRPEGHTVEWRNIHGKTIGNMENRTGCLVCHDDNRPAKAFRSTDSSCNSCHGDNHSDAWKYNHGSRVTSMTFNQECMRCHPAQMCGKCHYTGK